MQDGDAHFILENVFVSVFVGV